MREVVARRRECPVEQHDAVPDLGEDDVTRGEFVLIDADSGEPVLIQAKIGSDLRAVRRGLPTVKYEGLTSEGRLSGLRYAHRTFGYRPRLPLRRREACSSCNLAQEAPDLHDAIVGLEPEIQSLFARHAPDAFARHRAIIDDAVLPDWRINGGPYTSGIINATAALTYHRDKNNLPGCWSAMLVVRRHLRGGHLHVPEYDVAASCEDGMLLIFSGETLMHGVTPFRVRPGGYRYTIVWYAVANMKSCLPLADELAWGAAHRTQREAVEAAELAAAEADAINGGADE